METPIRSTVRAAKQFVNDGSKVLSVFMVIGVGVAIVALLPLGALFQAPAAATSKDTSPAGPVLSQRQDALKDAWLERYAEVVSPQAYTRERQDNLKEQWLARRSPVVGTYTVEMVQQQEALKVRWLERGVVTPSVGAAAATQRQEALKDLWLERGAASASASPAVAMVQRQEALKDLWLARR